MPTDPDRTPYRSGDRPGTDRPPLIWQLRSPGRIVDVRNRAGTRAQSSLPHAPGPDHRRPPDRTSVPVGQECVLLVSRSCDQEARTLTRLLGKVGVPCWQLNADDLSATTLAVDPVTRTVRAGSLRFTPALTWFRHFSEAAIDGSPDGSQALFARMSWKAAISQITDMSTATLQPRCPGPLAQLALASRLGIAIPRTLAVSHPSLAIAEFGGQPLVVKAVGAHFVETAAGILQGVFPEQVSSASLDTQWPTPAVPVIVQERIEHHSEIRLYLVDGRAFGFEVVKNSAADLWLKPDSVRVRAVPVPDQVSHAARSIAAQLNLRYGAFDFLLTASGPVFLEVNDNGDWCWIEEKSGTDVVTIAVTAMIAARYRQLAAPVSGSSDHSGRLDLLRFLA